MKNIIALILIITWLPSCTYYTQPKYTKVENIIKLTPGMEKTTVSNTLGIEPYDVYTIQKDGSTVFLYHYKHRQRELNTANAMNEKGLTEEAGREPKYLKPSRLFVMFDKDGKLNSVWSDEGTENTLRLLQIDQQARRYYSSQNNKDTISDLLLFTHTGAQIHREAETKLKKSNKGGLIAFFIIIGASVIAAVAATSVKE